MAGLPRAGVELVAEGQSAFQSALSGANKSILDFGSAAERAGGGVSAFGTIATGALLKLGEVAVSALGSAAQAFGGFIAGSVKGAGDFQANMSVFASVTGDALAQSGQSLESFSDLFIQLGKELPVSTAEVQQAAIELAKGGIDPATIAAGGLRTALDLAAAGGVGLAESATILSKQLGVWVDSTATAGEKAAFLKETADLLAQAANATTSSVDELSLGMANVGGTAKIAGLNLRETITGMALLSPGFSSAADAGTSFKTFLARLVPSTKPAKEAMADLGLYTSEAGSAFYDAQGKFVGLAKASEILRNATKDLTEEQRLQAFQTIFGQDAIRAAAILSEQGAAGYDRMTESLAAAGTVQEQAAARQQGFNTALDNAKGSLEALQLTIGTALLPVLTTLLNNVITPGINIVSEFASAFIALAMKGDTFTFFSKLGQIIMPLNQRFGEFVVSLGLASDPLAAVGKAINKAVPGFSAFASGVGAVGSGFAAIGRALLPLVPGFNGAAGGASVLSAIFITVAPVLQTIAKSLQGIATSLTILPNLWAVAGAATSSFSGQIGFVLDTLLGTRDTFQAFGQFISANLGPILAGLGGIIASALLPSLASAAGVFGGLVLSAGAIILPLVGAGLAAATLYQVWTQNLGGIQEKTAAVVGAISGVFGQLSGIVQAAMSAVVAGVQQSGPAIQASFAAYQSIASTVSGVFSSILSVVSLVLAQIQAFIATYGAQAVATFMTTWAAVQTTVAALLAGLASIIQPILANIQTFIADHGATIRAFFAATWQQINAVIQTALALINATIVPILQGIGAFIASHGTEIQSILMNSWTAISTIISTVLSTIQGLIQTVLQVIQGDWSGAWATLKETSATFVQGIITVVQAALSNLKTIFGMAIDAAYGAVAGYIPKFAQLGNDLVQGMINAVKNMGGALGGAIAGIISSALSAGQSAAKSSSPSKLFADKLGVPLGQGMVVGVQRQEPALQQAVTGAITRSVRAGQTIAKGGRSGGRTIGEALGRGIAEGASRTGGDIGAALSGALSKGTNAVKSTFGIASPSTVMAKEVGQPLGAGVVQGFQASLGDLPRAAANATAALSAATKIAGQQALDTAARQAVQEEKTKKVSDATLGAVRNFLLLNPAIDEVGVEALRLSGRLNVQAAALIKGALATKRMSVITRESAAASLMDATTKRAQEAQTKVLEAQTQKAVAAFLKLNPAIDANGIASAVAAGEIDPLVAQLVLVEQQALTAEAALAALQETAVKPSYTPDNGPLAFYQAQIEAQRALADVTQHLAQLRGDTAVSERRQSLDDATRTHEATENEYTEKRTAILSASDFDQDYYNERGELVKGRLSKLADLEDEYREKRTANAQAVQKAERALAAEQARVAANTATAATAQQQLATAQEQEARIRATDQRAASAYLALRVKQIQEVADLEKERADLTAQAALGDEGARIQLRALNARLTAVKKAQEGELLLWREQQRQQVIAGIAAARGIEEGMVTATPELLAEVNRIMDSIIRATNQQLEIHSPSGVTAKQIGKPFMQGIGVGITDALARTKATLGAAMAQLVSPTTIRAAAPASAVVRPPMSGQQIAQNHAASYDNHIGSIGVDARGSSLSAMEIRAAVDAALNARTRRGYGIRATGGYGR